VVGGAHWSFSILSAFSVFSGFSDFSGPWPSSGAMPAVVAVALLGGHRIVVRAGED